MINLNWPPERDCKADVLSLGPSLFTLVKGLGLQYQLSNLSSEANLQGE